LPSVIGLAAFDVLTIATLPSLFLTSQVQPEPKFPPQNQCKRKQILFPICFRKSEIVANFRQACAAGPEDPARRQ